VPLLRKLGHWARDCSKKKREEAHLVKEGEEEGQQALLMAQLCPTADEPEHIGGRIFLNEERAKVRLGDEREPVDVPWYLDSGASNHMTGSRSVFADLDARITGSVHFGDNSIVGICGRGTVVIMVRGDEHRALTDVYYIPKMKTSIVSLGQLDENGCPSAIHGGFMKVWDRSDQLLAKVPRSPNRPYKVALHIAQPACLSVRSTDAAWVWHERLAHQNFGALRTMLRQELVRGMPHIDHADHICDACLAGKQRRASFPQVAKFRATERLELVHADLCGPITPPTPGGKRYFLLMVDDFSRFMWLMLPTTKDEAEVAIHRVKAGAEVQSGCTLRTLRTDRGGEFTSRSFEEFCANNGVQRHLTAPYSPQQNGATKLWWRQHTACLRGVRPKRVLGGGGDEDSVPAESLLHARRRKRHSVRAVARHGARSSSPARLRMHRPRQDCTATSQET
jgi:transposase InsO family protein